MNQYVTRENVCSYRPGLSSPCGLIPMFIFSSYTQGPQGQKWSECPQHALSSPHMPALHPSRVRGRGYCCSWFADGPGASSSGMASQLSGAERGQGGGRGGDVGEGVGTAAADRLLKGKGGCRAGFARRLQGRGVALPRHQPPGLSWEGAHLVGWCWAGSHLLRKKAFSLTGKSRRSEGFGLGEGGAYPKGHQLPGFKPRSILEPEPRTLPDAASRMLPPQFRLRYGPPCLTHRRIILNSGNAD